MGLGMIIEMALTILRGFLTNAKKAAPYAKWLLRIRDYLLLLFPIEMYPKLSTEDLTLQNVTVTPVAISDVKAAGDKNGFQIGGIHF